MRLRRTRKKQKGGKILGAGADGCIFSQSAWPCSTETDISGYDVSDPKFVAKMVEKSDNEDKIIAIAASILTGADAKHLIKNYGVCSPVDDTTTDTTKLQALNENLNSIMTLHANQKENACTRLSDQTSTEIQNKTKLLVNSRFNSDLHHYVNKYSKTLNIIPKIIKAAIPFSGALKKMATNSANRLINLDLHSGNIFINSDTLGGPLIMGMADFGRCCYYDVNQSNDENAKTLHNSLINYVSEYNLQIRYPMIPIECRLFNTYITTNTAHTEADIIDRVIYLVQQDADLMDETTDPFYFVGGLQLRKLLNVFNPFLIFLTRWERLSNIKKRSVIMFVLYRFITVGFLGALISSLMHTTEFIRELIAINIAAEDYIKYYDNPNYNHRFNMNLISHRLTKFYYDELLAPYIGDFTDIVKVTRNEKQRNFEAIFADAMNLDSLILPPGPPGPPPGIPSGRPPLYPSRRTLVLPQVPPQVPPPTGLLTLTGLAGLVGLPPGLPPRTIPAQLNRPVLPPRRNTTTTSGGSTRRKGRRRQSKL